MDTVKFANVAIKAMGGTRSVSELFGVSDQVIVNWRKRGLPPESFYVLEPILTRLGFDADPTLFRQRVAVGKLRRNGKRKQG